MLMLLLYPHMDEDGRQQVSDSLSLPEDVLSDILTEETDDINILKEALKEDGN